MNLGLLKKCLVIVVLGCFAVSFTGCNLGSSSGGATSNPTATDTPGSLFSGKVFSDTTLSVSVRNESGSPSSGILPQTSATNLSPVASADVWLEEKPEIHGQSKADGSYTLSGIPAGQFRVVARRQSPDGKILIKNRSASYTAALQPAKIIITSLELKQALKTVKGILRDASGNPLKKTPLVLWGETFYTDDQGNFTAPALPETETVAEISGDQKGSAAGLVVMLPVGFDASSIDLTWDPKNTGKNRPPTVYLEKPQDKIIPGDAVKLVAKAFDPDSGDSEKLQYSWETTAGTLASDSSSANVVLKTPSIESFITVTVKATDPKGASGTFTISLLVGLDQPPSISNDYTSPLVTLTTPASGAVGISTGTTSIAVTFNEAMANYSTARALTLTSSDGQMVSIADGSQSSDKMVFTYILKSGLNDLISYTATIRGGQTGACDTSGNRLEKDFSWMFKTDTSINPSNVAWHLKKIGAQEAWHSSTGKDVVIAIVDSGVDLNHPALKPNLVPGYNYLDNTSDASDQFGHGTEIAGLAAAASSSLPLVGIAPQAKIMPIRVLTSDGRGTMFALAQGITGAVDRGARIINLSLGEYVNDSRWQSVIDYAGKKDVLIVATMGNRGNTDVRYPAAFPEVLSVGATDENDQRAPFSNFGKTIEVMAPGVNLTTTTKSSTYGSVSGTSASCPLVSGLAALVWARNPNATSREVFSLIASTCLDLGTTGFDEYYGWGRINALAAVAVASSARGLPVASSVRPATKPTPKTPVAYINDADRSFVAGDLIVTLSADKAAAGVIALIQTKFGGARVKQTISAISWYCIAVPQGKEKEIANDLVRMPGVAQVSLNYIVGTR